MRERIWPLCSAAAMARLDRHTIETLGVPSALLMECAGRAVLGAVLEELRPGAGVWVLCGAGSNAGDGLVVARQLHLLGIPARIVPVLDAAKWTGDAAANGERARTAGVPFASPRWQPEPGDVLVDALFGTGLARDVEGVPAAAIERINSERPACRVVAVDLPSGLDADTGRPRGTAVRADVTVTIGLPKIGLALEPGRSLAGRVRVARIGVADRAPEAAPDAELWTRAAAGARLPERPGHAHKGSFGHVLVAAGSRGKTGAAALTAQGAARAGAGLVTIACPEGVNAVLETKCTEAMTAPLPGTADDALAAGAEKALLELASERDVLAMGPGAGRAPETFELLRRVAGACERPLVLDADGVVAFAEAPQSLRERRPATLLTPHPGEAARLLGGSPAEANADRVASARRLAEATGAVVVLKGAGTVTADPEGRVAVNPTGGPLLGSGGTGDVLAGVAAGLLAQGVAPFEAGALAAFVHGHAADRLAVRLGPAGLLAGELAAEIPAAAASLRDAAARADDRLPLGAGLAVDFPEPG